MEEVDFLGFRIGMDSIRPCPEYLQAIRDFPQPKDITEVRSWFGLVKQAAYAFSNSDIMLPFRELLKPLTEFVWTQELQNRQVSRYTIPQRQHPYALIGAKLG